MPKQWCDRARSKQIDHYVRPDTSNLCIGGAKIYCY